MDVQLHLVQFSTQRLELLRHESQLDAELAEIKDDRIKDTKYHRNCESTGPIDLSVEDGLVMKGNCVMVPQSIQAEILQTLHSADDSVDKRRARTCVYWSNMNTDVTEMVDKCGTCLSQIRARCARKGPAC